MGAAHQLCNHWLTTSFIRVAVAAGNTKRCHAVNRAQSVPLQALIAVGRSLYSTTAWRSEGAQCKNTLLLCRISIDSQFAARAAVFSLIPCMPVLLCCGVTHIMSND